MTTWFILNTIKRYPGMYTNLITFGIAVAYDATFVLMAWKHLM